MSVQYVEVEETIVEDGPYTYITEIIYTPEPRRPCKSKLEGWITAYFVNPDYTELVQLVVAFAFGVIFSPFSYGPLFFIIWLVLYEFAYAYYTNTECPYWRLFFRVALIMASILGWLIGRTVVGWRNPFRVSPNDP